MATSAGSRPALSSSSISSRCSRAMLPWWARTRSSPASSLRRWASRSASRRLLVKTIVLRCARISSRMRGWIAGQMLVRRSSRQAGASEAAAVAAAAASGGERPRRGGSCPRPGRRPRARAACACRRRRSATSRPGPTPPRNRAIVSSGRCVADRPIRWSGGASRRRGVARAARATARGARRACVPAIAWTSSTITVLDVAQDSRAADWSAAGTGSRAS